MFVLSTTGAPVAWVMGGVCFVTTELLDKRGWQAKALNRPFAVRRGEDKRFWFRKGSAQSAHGRCCVSSILVQNVLVPGASARRGDACQSCGGVFGGGSVFDGGLKAAAAVLAISGSISLLKPAIPTAPTTSPFTRTGMPPASAMILAVTNAVRPSSMLSSISAVGRCSRAAVRAFWMASSALAGRTPSIRWNASRSPAGSTTAIADGAFRCCALSVAACSTACAPAWSRTITLMVCAAAGRQKIAAKTPAGYPKLFNSGLAYGVQVVGAPPIGRFFLG